LLPAPEAFDDSLYPSQHRPVHRDPVIQGQHPEKDLARGTDRFDVDGALLGNPVVALQSRPQLLGLPLEKGQDLLIGQLAGEEDLDEPGDASFLRGESPAQPVGLLQQNPLHQLVCDTVEEEVYFGPRNLEVKRAREMERETEAEVEAVLAQTDLLPLRHRLTQALSVGQQQRTALAATLSLHPALLILDEPTVGQDWGHLIQVGVASGRWASGKM